MSHRLLIRSRFGNVILGVLGATYILSAMTLIGILLRSTRAWHSPAEIIIEAILIGCAIEGIWLATTSARNLKQLH